MEIRRDNPGTFFPWPGEPKGSQNGITVRVMNPEAVNRLDDETTEERTVVIDGQLYKDRVITDPEKRQKMRLDYCITGWKGLTEDGKEIPCTAETKLDCMRKDPALAKFFTECIDKLNQLIDERAGIIQKNSPRSRSGAR